ncbi:MAG: PTS transporter subunit EIIC, partial [Deferribacteraceae bacterium]|nr:PTS transporter subunit EIIC [Deferribacteraceae bacterium]
MADNKQIANDVLKAVGGKKNIVSVVHCATRLRFKLQDESIPNDDAIKAIAGVISVVRSGGQYQVIIGNNVGDVYLHLSPMVGNKGDTGGQQAKGKESPFAKFLDVIAAIFTPFLGLMAGAGILKGLYALLTATKIMDPASATAVIVNAAGDGIFFFLPMILAITAARKFKTSEFIALAVAAFLLHPSLGGLFMIPGALAADAKFLGFIPVVAMTYSSSVIPILFAVFIQSHVERAFNRIMPEVVRNVLTPACTLLVMSVLTILLVGPAGAYVGKGLAFGYTSLYNTSSILAGAIIGGFWQVLVIFGLHWAFVPLMLVNISTQGRDYLAPAVFPAVLAQSGAAFAVAFKTRNKSLKSIAFSAGITAIFGITEPAVYGVTLRLKKPFYAACIAGAISGALIGAFGSVAYAFGLPSLLAMPLVLNPSGMDTAFIMFAASVVLSWVLAFALTLILGFEDIPETAADNTPAAAPVVDEGIGFVSDGFTIASPLVGKVMPLKEIKDDAFASGMMGQGIAVDPVK